LAQALVAQLGGDGGGGHDEIVSRSLRPLLPPGGKSAGEQNFEWPRKLEPGWSRSAICRQVGPLVIA
jgi:hypothetical protein